MAIYRDTVLYDSQLISSPSPYIIELLKDHMSLRTRTAMDSEQAFGAVGLVEGKLVDMFAAADIALKSAPVRVAEILGLCPQHFTMIAIFGDSEGVNTSLQAIAARLSRPPIAGR